MIGDIISRLRAMQVANPDALGAMGIGMLSGQTTPQALALGFQGMQGARQQMLERQKAEADAARQQAQMTATAAFLKARGADPSLIQMAQSGAGKDAFDMWSKTQPVAPTPTDDMREYEFAKGQGFQGTLSDWILQQRKASAAQQNVTVGGGRYGTIPQGYELIEGPNGASMKPIPGGPAAMEQDAATKANDARRAGEVNRGNIVTEEIDRALNIMNTGVLPDTGMGSLLSGVPGTDAKALSSLLDTVKANIGFEELNRMRQQSPTGGALGQVTERELAFLQSVAGSLDQAQSKEQLTYNLNRLWDAYMDVIHGPNAGPPRRTKTGGEVGATAAPQRYRFNPQTGELE